MNPYFLPYSQWTPRMLSSRFPVTRLNRNGIPSLRTISVTTDTTGSAVIYNICPWRWKQLCNEGLMILRISQVPATGSETFVVSINPNSTQNTTVDNSKEINDLKNDVADIRKMIEDTKKMFMGGFPKPPMPPMPNLPAPMK